MAKGRRLVAFDQEMAGPGEAVGHHRPQQRIPRMLHGKRNNQRAQAQDRSCGMQQPVARMRVFAQIKREEFVVAGKARLCHFVAPVEDVSAATD